MTEEVPAGALPIWLFHRVWGVPNAPLVPDGLTAGEVQRLVARAKEERRRLEAAARERMGG